MGEKMATKKEWVDVKLTREELLEKGRELADVIQEMNEAELELTGASTDACCPVLAWSARPRTAGELARKGARPFTPKAT